MHGWTKNLKAFGTYNQKKATPKQHHDISLKTKNKLLLMLILIKTRAKK